MRKIHAFVYHPCAVEMTQGPAATIGLHTLFCGKAAATRVELLGVPMVLFAIDIALPKMFKGASHG